MDGSTFTRFLFNQNSVQRKREPELGGKTSLMKFTMAGETETSRLCYLEEQINISVEILMKPPLWKVVISRDLFLSLLVITHLPVFRHICGFYI